MELTVHDDTTPDSCMDSSDSVMMTLEEPRAVKKQRLRECRQGFEPSSLPSVMTIRNGSTSSATSALVSSVGFHSASEHEPTKDPTRWWFRHSELQPGMVLSEQLGNPSDAVESLSHNARNWSLTRLHNSPQSKSSEKSARQQSKHAHSCVRRALLFGTGSGIAPLMKKTS